MPFENLAPWRTTPKPPCSSSGMGFHPGSLFVFHGMHTKREVAPPDTTSFNGLERQESKELAHVCCGNTGCCTASPSSRDSHCPTVSLHPEDWQDSSGLTCDRSRLVLPHSGLQEVTSEPGLVLSSACRKPSLLLPLWWPYLHQAGLER